MTQSASAADRERSKRFSESLVAERYARLFALSPEELLRIPEFANETTGFDGRKYRVQVEHRMTKKREHWMTVEAGPVGWFGVWTVEASAGFAFGPAGRRELCSEEIEWSEEIADRSPKSNL